MHQQFFDDLPKLQGSKKSPFLSDIFSILLMFAAWEGRTYKKRTGKDLPK